MQDFWGQPEITAEENQASETVIAGVSQVGLTAKEWIKANWPIVSLIALGVLVIAYKGYKIKRVYDVGKRK